MDGKTNRYVRMSMTQLKNTYKDMFTNFLCFRSAEKLSVTLCKLVAYLLYVCKMLVGISIFSDVRWKYSDAEIINQPHRQMTVVYVTYTNFRHQPIEYSWGGKCAHRSGLDTKRFHMKCCVSRFFLQVCVCVWFFSHHLCC